MKVEYVCHACLLIETADLKIVTDPWFNGAAYCNQCGSKLDPERAPRDGRGRARLHADLAHPINSATRIELHKAVVRAYVEEMEAQKQAGPKYRPKDFDDLDELNEILDAEYIEELERRQEERERRRRDVHGTSGGGITSNAV